MRWSALFAVGIVQCAAQTPTMLGPHRIGETVQEWLSANHTDLTATCGDGQHPMKPESARINCVNLTAAVAGKTAAIERDGQQWTFVGGKAAMVSIGHAMPNMAEQIGFLVEKYGEPTEKKTVTYQNAFGAKWECLQATWQMPDGAVILAAESVKNLRGPTRWLTVSFVSKERLEQVAAEQKAKANPYK